MQPGDSSPHASDMSQSPTITSPALATHDGVILGTATYMSPEQAKGKPVDRRSDMWAFGCVLYEMLTGKRAFEGEDVSETLAEVLKSEPDWRSLPSETPESIRRLLRRCLAKDCTARQSDAAAARLEILDAKTPPTASSASIVTSTWRVWFAALLILFTAAGAAWILRDARITEASTTRFIIQLPPEVDMPGGATVPLVISRVWAANRIRCGSGRSESPTLGTIARSIGAGSRARYGIGDGAIFLTRRTLARIFRRSQPEEDRVGKVARASPYRSRTSPGFSAEEPGVTTGPLFSQRQMRPASCVSPTQAVLHSR